VVHLHGCRIRQHFLALRHARMVQGACLQPYATYARYHTHDCRKTALQPSINLENCFPIPFSSRATAYHEHEQIETTAPVPTEPRGYHRLADLMGHYPEAAILRSFGSLNMLNLLSLQAELVDLEVQFRDIWVDDDNSPDDSEKQYSTSFRQLHHSGDSIQFKMLLDIRKKLSEYSTCRWILIPCQ
jgi:hypothetical protein